MNKPGVENTPTAFRYRVRTPAAFAEDSFRIVPFQKVSPKINSVMGKLKGGVAMTLQSFIFSKEEGWDEAKVNEWVEGHRDSLKDSIVANEMRLEAIEEWIDAPTIEDQNLAELMRSQASLPVTKDGESVLFKGYRGEVKGVREDSFEADVVISSGDIDRDKEVVEPQGMVVAKPKRVPLVAGHTYGDLRKHIGDAGKPKHFEAQIHARPKWFVGMGNAEADWAWTLAKLGVAAFSIGFIPLEWTDADLTDEKTLAKIQEGKEPLRRYTKWELVEVSQVVVPSNRNAIQRMIDAGILEAKSVEGLVAKAAEGDMSDGAQKLFDAAMTDYEAAQKARATRKEEITKPRDEHGCEPGYEWNADTGKCEKAKDAAPVPVVIDNILETFVDAQPAPVETPKTPIEEMIDTPEKREVELSSLLDVEMAIDAATSVILGALEGEGKRLEAAILGHKQEIRVTIDTESLTEALKATFEKAFQSKLPEDSAAFVSVKALVPELVNTTLVVVRQEIEKAQGKVEHFRRG